MKPENISDAMGYIEDELVVSAGESRNRKNNKLYSLMKKV